MKFKVQGSKFRVQSSRFRFQISEFRSIEQVARQRIGPLGFTGWRSRWGVPWCKWQHCCHPTRPTGQTTQANVAWLPVIFMWSALASMQAVRTTPSMFTNLHRVHGTQETSGTQWSHRRGNRNRPALPPNKTCLRRRRLRRRFLHHEANLRRWVYRHRSVATRCPSC